MSRAKLFNVFSPTSAKAWKQQIQFDLKGADYNNTLVWDSLDGIKVKPFFHAEDLNEKHFSEIDCPSSWKIGQGIYVATTSIANKKALDILQKGVESLEFIIPNETVDIIILLKGIDLSRTVVYFELQFLSQNYIQQIRDLVGNNQCNIYLNIDIIGHLARTGNWFESLNRDHEKLKLIIDQNTGEKLMNILSVDMGLYQNAGANRIQQLAYALAHANEYLHYLTNNGLTLVKSITFKVAIDSNYFFEIAKLRALRLLFNSLIAHYGIKVECHIIATPTKRNKTIYDPYVNMLRTTTEYMSSVLGGANIVKAMAFDSIYFKSNEFSERISRNQLLVIKNESYFDKVANPTAGSYYVESLTQEMAEKALALFKNIEKGGGFLKQLKAHNIQKKIKEAAGKEQTLFNKNEKVLVGTNKQINTLDKMKDKVQLYPFVKTKARKTLLEPVLEKRLAEDLEKKRLQNE